VSHSGLIYSAGAENVGAEWRESTGTPVVPATDVIIMPAPFSPRPAGRFGKFRRPALRRSRDLLSRAALRWPGACRQSLCDPGPAGAFSLTPIAPQRGVDFRHPPELGHALGNGETIRLRLQRIN
jgi:hypothetical protein